ncbi:MAG: hypothetical protein JWN43_700, partial [Gammaproteobacteria bacterium]|nr:hypothetical protein [Gammaproteobacteria bacterium]
MLSFMQSTYHSDGRCHGGDNFQAKGEREDAANGEISPSLVDG